MSYEAMEVLGQFIASYGFPIVACCALFWYMTKQTEVHKAETDTLKEAIKQLEIAVLKLCNKIDGN